MFNAAPCLRMRTQKAKCNQEQHTTPEDVIFARTHKHLCLTDKQTDSYSIGGGAVWTGSTTINHSCITLKYT